MFNDTQRQQASTAAMIRSVAELISFISPGLCPFYPVM
ncbi:MAG: fumarylacetoacetate hydrolase family protein [Proteobacteria bacterium]|nr:fumarylacetoacetate hydrolase family protein [Pseudomonadota bacterium]MBU4297790.1 fumarylacetoacetate hydrolase family protein [Pseudomonadota bacterium]MCG2748325.1 fumarylacetoacetate hydrolase family protein [Desulfobulbaceae bacterium]